MSIPTVWMEDSQTSIQVGGILVVGAGLLVVGG